MIDITELENYTETDLISHKDKETLYRLGEWTDEPDHIEFSYDGIRCFCSRAVFSGAWCGYIKIPKGSPFYEVDYNRIPFYVHGGLTYGESCDDETYTIGFDCAHCTDISPAMTEQQARYLMKESLKKLNLENNPFFNPVYRNKEFVIDEIVSLVKQLKEHAEKVEDD